MSETGRVPCGPKCNGTWPHRKDELARPFHVQGCPNDPAQSGRVLTVAGCRACVFDSVPEHTCIEPDETVIYGGDLFGPETAPARTPS